MSMEGLKLFAVIVLAMIAWDTFKAAAYGIAKGGQRGVFVIGVVVLLVLAASIAGCTVEPPAAHPVRHPGTNITCGDLPRDGSYLLLRCAG